jgi:hypothetical protein
MGKILFEDRILESYRIAMMLRYTRLKRPLPSRRVTENDDTFFNQPQDILRMDIIFFIQHWITKAKPRALVNKRPKIGSVTRRRNAILFWVREKRDEGITLHYQRLYRDVTKGIQSAILKVWGTTRQTEHIRKMFFGRAELRELLDHEAFFAQDPEMSEQHEVSWCLTCICGVRPCSMARLPVYAQKDSDCLRWRNLEITRVFNNAG